MMIYRVVGGLSARPPVSRPVVILGAAFRCEGEFVVVWCSSVAHAPIGVFLLCGRAMRWTLSIYNLHRRYSLHSLHTIVMVDHHLRFKSPLISVFFYVGDEMGGDLLFVEPSARSGWNMEKFHLRTICSRCGYERRLWQSSQCCLWQRHFPPVGSVGTNLCG